jgi:hypothetical protein
LLLLPLWPFVSVAAYNRDEFIDLVEVGQVAAATLAVALAVTAIARGLFRRSALRDIGDLVALLSCAFFSFPAAIGLSQSILPERARYYLITWTTIVLLLIALHALLRRTRGYHPALSAASIALVVVAGLPLLAPAKRKEAGPVAPITARANGGQGQVAERPNVYWIILDAYARADQLARVLDYDNSEFLAALRSRGFTVLDHAVANYPLTRLSIPSTLNAEFLLDDVRVSSPEHAVDVLRGNNATVRFFKSLNYRYVHAQPGVWGPSSCGEPEGVCVDGRHRGAPCGLPPDVCIRGDESLAGVSQTQILLMELTPITSILRVFPVPTATALWLRRRVLSSFTTLDVVRTRLAELGDEGPFFAFVHIMQPHPPNLYHADCSPKDEIELDLEAWKVHEDGYVDNVSCANLQSLRLLDEILERDPDAWIILQSDHGTAFTIDLKAPLATWSPDQIAERMGVLNAMRLPARCRDLLYPSISLINSLAVISACLGEREPEYLPDISYLTPNDSSHPEFGKVRRVVVPADDR